jgi:hypothetical protein
LEVEDLMRMHLDLTRRQPGGIRAGTNRDWRGGLLAGESGRDDGVAGMVAFDVARTTKMNPLLRFVVRQQWCV